MNKIKNNPHLSLLLACLVVLFGFLSLTNPEHVPVGLLVVPVVLTFLIVFSSAHLLLRMLHKFDKQPGKRRVVALIAGSMIAILMILQSSGGLSSADLVIMGLILVITSLYVSRY